jgi:serine/threonine protein kinase
LSSTSSETKPPSSARPEVSSDQIDEERLAHALVSRGLVAKEEVQSCRSHAGALGAEGLLKSLVKAGFLTQNQARRAHHEIAALLHQQIPGYELIQKLGQGSMGTVYKARQLSLNRLVAIKMLHPRLAAKHELLQRLEREARLAGKLSHNNLVQAIDVGSAGSLYYFVMEYVEGTTIKEELEKGKIYSEAAALNIIMQVAQALQHAHRRELIHRDVKPANIVLTPEGVAKLADLGMARETTDEELARAEKGMTIGTPYYISTEQIHGHEDIDARADIYSLGATLYHMVTGQPPFPGTDVDFVLDAHLHQELTPPDHLNTALSSGLGEVVEVMMAKEKAQRYNSTDDLIIDLECLLNGQPPKLARNKIQAETLERLGEGEEEDEEGRGSWAGRTQVVWLCVLGSLLTLSILANVIMLFRR